MATQPTQNSVPSESPRDLKFNAGKFDEVITSFAEWYIDRFGNKHYTVQGLKALFDSKIYEWDQIFQQFLVSSGYQFLGDYVDGPLTFTERNQYIRYDGQYWKLNAETDLDFTTTGTDATSWSSDVTHLSLIDGDTLRQELASDNGSNLVATRLPYASSVKRTQTDKNLDVYTASDFGIKGDGTDETQKLLSLITNRNGRKIDLQGKSIKFSSAFEVSLSNPLHIENGRLIYDGASYVYGIRIRTSSHININDLIIDGGSLAAKGLQIIAMSNDASMTISNYQAQNMRETGGTGLAAGIYILADSDKCWSNIVLKNIKVRDITNSGQGTNVGRGVMVENFASLMANGLDVRRVAPYQDSDGIYVASLNYPEATVIISDSYFEDCQKRSIKSQVRNTKISNTVHRRTQAFTAAEGQTEIDLQAGGSCDGARMVYADGAAPQTILNGWNPGATFSNVDVVCADTTDVIPRLVSFFNNTSNVLDTYSASNISCNAMVQNALYLYSNTGNSNPDTYIFKEVLLRNVKCSGIASTTSAAVAQISRGAGNYVKAIVRLFNCNLGDGTTASMAYLDPAPGATTLLGINFRQISNSRGFNNRVPENSDTSARIFATTQELAENATTTLSIPIQEWKAGRTALKVSVFYNSNRDGSTTKLFTEGYWFYGSTAAYYVESVAGVKSSAQTGAISIVTSSNNIAVNKTAGTGGAGGQLSVIFEHISAMS
ncbi:hypothetical protein QPR61_13840 [Enterobacter hormaechei]|uniref:hypothetical protein n=3 Tax=Enterobacter hormaechei TaxID=158836 RepID=UPI00079ABACC|nr:hypothetical protein [Enterobacter hormaechei]RAY85737.1 hypothetical protein DP188_07295 [Enterobacter hormaechei subsp. steigerwaltii]WLZ67089.1 hypothetical protein QPR61_13840 [Enterobacter hormaechei]WLZ71789.1 hypothetical protein QPR72_13835 [Enterobacter hormaechei]WLZ78387.1 hypothetical protein QPR69_22235 [Enterobacter hormaechei]WLZ81678.1 hypothetical protein QPR80_13835 [Enterobacter hormaechei]